MSDTDQTEPTVELTVRDGDETTSLHVAQGANLRRELLDAGFGVYGPLSERVNCGGRGLCATCTVCIATEAPEPTHWHDRAAVTFGYPRLSCQVPVDRPMTVRLLDKWIWGQLLPRRYDPTATAADAGACENDG